MDCANILSAFIPVPFGCVDATCAIGHSTYRRIGCRVFAAILIEISSVPHRQTENCRMLAFSMPWTTLGGALRSVFPGLLLSVKTLLFCFELGAVFGLSEDLIKSRLSASAAAAPA